MGITNTTKQDAREHLAMAMMMGGSDAIELSEANGQAELVHSEQLPTDNHDRETMEAWGIVFGEPCADDPMFCNATLPKGWKKEATDHSMWSRLVDEKGRERAAIFYKAAFYDRSAHMSASRRFVVRKDYEVEGKVIKFDVLVDGKVLHSVSLPYAGEKYRDDWQNVEQVVSDSCKEWLTENYPGHDDPVASWDIEVVAK